MTDHILIIRFSALGDVAATIPVVWSLAAQYPALQITVLSRKQMQPLFAQMPANVRFVGVDLQRDFKGLDGLRKLYHYVQNGAFTAVADLHDVLRTKYIRTRFRLLGKRVAYIQKDRGAYRRVLSHKERELTQLRTVFEKYCDVFKELGYPIAIRFRSIFGQGRGELSSLPFTLTQSQGEPWIGIAPFAAHEGKVYPYTLMEEVVKGILTEIPQCKIFFFGYGATEAKIVDAWVEKYPTTYSTIGKMGSMTDDLVLMSHLNAVVSMDSANMHLASLVGIPVVSLWGATHPCMGFLGWKQSPKHALTSQLPCQPCSVFGNKPCTREDQKYKCFTQITPQQVVQTLYKIVNRTDE